MRDGETVQSKGEMQMNPIRQLFIVGLATVIVLGLGPATRAQVSCSPEVPVKTCKEAAKVLDVPLKSKVGAVHGGVQLELVSPAEYKLRINEIKKKIGLGPVETLGCGPGSEKAFFQNCAGIDVLFFRDSISDMTPKHILASSDEAVDALMLSYFVQGYYAGLLAEMAESQNEK
jgi:hypothetical protein